VTTLYLLRHAKSDWAATYGADHDRPLNERGVKAAAKIGRFLAGLGQVPERIVTSSALRALTTARLAAAAGDWTTQIEVDPSLYGTDAHSVLSVVRSQPLGLESLLLVGHQPTWSDLAGRLVGDARVAMPTAGLVRIDFYSDWRGVEFGGGELVWLVRPKILLEVDPPAGD